MPALVAVVSIWQLEEPNPRKSIIRLNMPAQAALTLSFWAVYKSGTGTRGRGHRDACVGTWDLGTRDEGLGDVKYGTRGRQKLGRREPGMLMIIAKVGGKCDISFFVKMCYLWSTLDSIFQNHIGHLMMFTQNISL